MEFEDIKQKNLFGDKPLSVKQFVDQINARLKPFFAKIIGEVSEAKPGPTGHMYFSLKDENNGALMPCALWKSRYDVLGVQLKVGAKIIASGHAEVYAPSGRLSFICDSIELAGEGALKAAYDALFKKLDGEGIFAAPKKRPLPKYCRKIGVITAKQGAVIHDFLNNIGKFGFQIEFIDSRVEGQLAVPDLLAAINTFSKRQIDVLVVMRGGGSLEAMQAFNNETIVRAIANFHAPVIAAIGHDKDVPLAALAADAMCSTPTAAANLLTQSWQEIFRALDKYENSIIGNYGNAIAKTRVELRQYIGILTSFKYLLREIEKNIGNRVSGIIGNYKNLVFQDKIKLRQYTGILGNFRYILKNIISDINNGFLKEMTFLKNALATDARNILYFQKIIDSNNPERQLRLGYSIAKINGKIIKSVKDAQIGQNMEIKLADGAIDSQIIKIHGNNQKN
jgi:exodeoxyribonuclease VII large subunit